MKCLALWIFLFSGMVQAETSFESFLKEALTSAVAHDFEFKKRQKDYEIAQVGLKQKKFEFAPEVSLRSSIDDNDSFSRNSVGVSINIFNGFQDQRALETARLTLREKELQRLVRERKVKFDTAFRVIDWSDLLLRIQVQEDELGLRQGSLDIMKRRFERGMVPEDEFLKMQVDLLNSQVDLQELKQRKTAESRAFKDVIGIDVNRYPVVALPFPAFERFAQPQRRLLDKMAKEASPEIQDNRAKMARASSSWSEAKAAVYAPSLTGRYDYFNSPTSSSPYDYQGRFAIELSAPLFSQWEDQAEQQRAKLRFEKAKFDLAQKTRDVLLEMNQRLDEILTIQTSYKLQKQAVEIAEKFYRQAVKRFRLGVGNSNDMAFDLQRLTRSKTRLSRLKKNFFQAAIQINLSSGKDISDLF